MKSNCIMAAAQAAPGTVPTVRNLPLPTHYYRSTRCSARTSMLQLLLLQHKRPTDRRTRRAWLPQPKAQAQQRFD